MVPQAAVRWATEAGVPVGDVLHAWHCGTTVDVPIGCQWEVLRVTARIGWAALALMRADSFSFGPVLEARPRRTVEILVPPGTAAVWPPLDRSRCVAVSRGTLRCPPPWTTSLGAEVNGRRWFCAPVGPLPYTDADALCEAVAIVMASHRRRREPLDDPEKAHAAYGSLRRLTPSHP
jgi:hypothetical protein